MTRAGLVLLALPGLLGSGGCTGGEEGQAKAASGEAEKGRVLRFWSRYNAATEARTRRAFAEAAEAYAEALALDPRHEDSLYYLGQCRRELGDPKAARAAFERLVETNPASARGHLALGALLASPDPLEPMDLEAAEDHLRRAHEINGEETGPVVRLGEAALVGERVQEARGWFEAALRANPKCVEAAFLAGYLGWEAGLGTAPLVERVRSAAKVEAPVAGVLGEGDRRDTSRAAAPPLASPLGRLLFGEPILRLRSEAAAGRPLSEEAVVQAWREVRRARRAYERRAMRVASR
jgi:tetratricopeptide (TPR) repeat protein